MTDHPARHDRLIKEHIHDPYRLRSKPAGPLVCPQCKAVYQAGRWQWLQPAPEGAEERLCQACLRIRDECPAGIIVADGPFVQSHRDEIEAVCRNQQEREGGEHPMNRIMALSSTDEGIVVTTTDIHLPRRIGEALQNAYDGELSLDYEKEVALLRVKWHR